MLAASMLLALSVSTPNARADGDAEAGKALYAQCETCHGADGGGSQAKGAPRLAGQRDDYLLRQLRNFSDTVRSSDKMHEMASKLTSNSERKNVVAYINTLSAPTPPDTVTGDVELGEATFVLCSQCHGGRAHGSSLYDTPRLAGQHDWYLLKQLQAFSKGHRGTDPSDIYGAQMQEAISALSGGEKVIKDVVAYINTLE